MRKTALVLFSLFIALSSIAQTRRYVKTDGTNINPATAISWQTASNDLQAVIDASAKGDQIWVAEGEYIPTVRVIDNTWGSTTSESDKTFLITKGIDIYGGFAGTEAVLSQRNKDLNKTILSGDVWQQGFYDDNSYHVVVIAINRTENNHNGDESLTLDGFQIAKGRARAHSVNSIVNIQDVALELDRRFGAGIHATISQTAPIKFTLNITNNEIHENHANTGLGGAIHISNYAEGKINFSKKATSIVNLKNNLIHNNKTIGLNASGTGVSSLTDSRAYGYPSVNIENNKIYKNTSDLGVAGVRSATRAHKNHTTTPTNNGFLTTNILNNEIYENANSGYGGGGGAMTVTFGDNSIEKETRHNVTVKGNKIYKNSSNDNFQSPGIFASLSSGIRPAIYMLEIAENEIYENICHAHDAKGGGLKIMTTTLSKDLKDVLVNVSSNHIYKNKIMGNASKGGGVYLELVAPNVADDTKSNISFYNNLIHSNHAAAGGGIYLNPKDYSTINMIGNSLYANTATTATGLAIENANPFKGNLFFANNLVWEGAANNAANTYKMALTGAGKTIFRNSLIQGTSDIDLNGTDGSNNIDGSTNNPLATKEKIFIDFDNQNYRLLHGSIAIDASSPGYTEITRIREDYDKLPRVMGEIADLGVYECPWGSVYLDDKKVLFNNKAHTLEMKGWEDKLTPLAESTPTNSKTALGTYTITSDLKMKSPAHALLYPTVTIDGTLAIRATGVRRYVRTDGTNTDPETALSWNTASNDIQAVIDVSEKDDEIWVAKGTYYPNKIVELSNPNFVTTDRDKTFLIRKGIAFYGGFAGTETLLSQRNLSANKTILSGDIGTKGDDTDNAHHVLVVSIYRTLANSNGNETLTIDGFSITEGNAVYIPTELEYQMAVKDGVGISRRIGAGIVASIEQRSNSNFILNVTNNEIYDNHAIWGGGADMNIQSEGDKGHEAKSTINFRNNQVYKNSIANTKEVATSSYGGGAIRSSLTTRLDGYATLNIEDNKIYKNTSGTGVAGISYNSLAWFPVGSISSNNGYTQTSISNNEIYENTETGDAGGGAIYAISGYERVRDKGLATLTINNNKVYKNSTNSPDFSAGIYALTVAVDKNSKHKLEISRNEIFDNISKADDALGGGLKVHTATRSQDDELVLVDIYYNKIYNNKLTGANSRGGGAYIVSNGLGEYTSSKSFLQFYHNYISDNEAQIGGGLYVFGYGYATLDATNNSIYNNTATRASQLFIEGSPNPSANIYTYEGSIKFFNTLVWGGEQNGVSTYEDHLGGTGELKFNNSLIQGFPDNYFDGTNNLDGSTNNKLATTNKIFVDWQQRNYRLQHGSIAINAGNKNTANMMPLDNDNQARVRGANIDLGVYESPWTNKVWLEDKTVSFDNNAHTLVMKGWDSPLSTIANKTEPTTATTVGTHTITAKLKMKNAGDDSRYPEVTIEGTLNITTDVGDDYITFEPLTDKIYGDAPFDLVGSHLQGKEIYFTTSANDVVSVAKDGASWKATILKPGMVTLTAKYDGDNVVAEGSKSQTIAIAKAELTLTANDVSRNFNEANPSVVDAYTAEWVKVEDKDLFNPAPTVSIDPQYTISTPAGEYPNAVIVTGASHPYYNITDKNGKLTILDIELKLIELRVNNERHEVGERYVVKKDYTGPSVTLEVIGTSNAVVNDLPATANVDKPSLQTIKFNLTNLSNTEKIEYEFEIEKRFQFEDLIIMRWNNVLTVINRPETTGFEYVAYQWYKNDEPINGANRQSYSASKEGQGLKDTDEYYVEVTDKATGKVLRCWEEKVDLREQNILAYPVPVRQQELITIEANVDEELLENATIAIFNSIGTKLSNHTVTGNITQVPAPAAAGFYILRLYGKDGFSKDFKIVVQ